MFVYEFTIFNGPLIFLILKISNIIHKSTILGGSFIFLIIVLKPKATTKLN